MFLLRGWQLLYTCSCSEECFAGVLFSAGELENNVEGYKVVLRVDFVGRNRYCMGRG